MRRSLQLSLTCLLLLGCSENKKQGKQLKLPSGREVQVIMMGPSNNGNGNPPFLRFEYQSNFEISITPEYDFGPLLREIDEIWPVLRVNADQGNFRTVVIEAHGKPRGLIFKKSGAYSSMYVKLPNGDWHKLALL